MLSVNKTETVVPTTSQFGTWSIATNLNPDWWYVVQLRLLSSWNRIDQSDNSSPRMGYKNNMNPDILLYILFGRLLCLKISHFRCWSFVLSFIWFEHFIHFPTNESLHYFVLLSRDPAVWLGYESYFRLSVFLGTWFVPIRIMTDSVFVWGT